MMSDSGVYSRIMIEEECEKIKGDLNYLQVPFSPLVCNVIVILAFSLRFEV